MSGSRQRRNLLLGAATLGASALSVSSGAVQVGGVLGPLSESASRRRGAIPVEDFGPIGNRKDGDDATIQRAIVELRSSSSGQGCISLPRGTVYLKQTLSLGRGISIVGAGPNFTSQIAPVSTFNGETVIAFDGTREQGGWAFRSELRDFAVNCISAPQKSVKAAISISRSYSIQLINVLVHEPPNRGISIYEVNNISLAGCTVFRGRRNIASGISARKCNLLRISDVDIEGFECAVECLDAAVVTLHMPYIERCTRCIEVTASDASIFVNGGMLRLQLETDVALLLQAGRAHLVATYIDEVNQLGQPILVSDKATHRPTLQGVFSSKRQITID